MCKVFRVFYGGTFSDRKGRKIPKERTLAVLNKLLSHIPRGSAKRVTTIAAMPRSHYSTVSGIYCRR